MAIARSPRASNVQASGPVSGSRLSRPWRHGLALPSLGWTVLFFIAPLAVLFVYSFGQIDIVTFQMRFGWTLSNYERIGSELYLTAILRSFMMSVGATLVCLLIGYPVAYTISRQPARRQTLLLIGIMIPFWTSFVVRSYALVTLLSDSGPIAGVARALGIVDGPLNILYTPVAVAIGILYDYLPLMILPLYVALERIDPALREAAGDLGATGWRVFRRVIFPLSVPGVIAGCILVGIPATGEYVIPAILGGGKTLMYGNIVADQFLAVGDYPFGSALAVGLMAIMTVALLLGRGRLGRFERVT